jgi:cytochrome c oxidase subunit 4
MEKNPVIQSLAKSDYANANIYGSSHGDLAHIASPTTLVTIFAMLVLLTGATVGVSYLGLGNYALIVALVIALIKSTLVCLYFMHLRYDKPFNIVIFLGCLIFVTIFISFSLTDSGQYHPTQYDNQPKGIPTDPGDNPKVPGNVAAAK